MANNIGMTNSARFFDSKTKKFDIEKCFNIEATSIKHVLTNMRYILDNPELFTEDEVQFHANNLADEFYTILKVALEWEEKKLKK